MNRLSIVVAAAALVAGALFGCGDPPNAESPRRGAAGSPAPPATSAPEAPAPAGEWVAAAERSVRSALPATGTFVARRTTRLGTQVSGRVEKVLVDTGDSVREGDVLVKIDDGFFAIEVEQRRAELTAAKVELEERELNFNRMKNLFEKKEGAEPSVPRKLFDDARSGVEGARARLAKAEAALRWNERQLAETSVRAPYDAVVTARLVDPGEPVTTMPITPLVEVQEVSTLELEFSLPQELLPRVKPGTPARFDVGSAAGGERSVAIETVYPVIDAATRSFRCRAIVPNGDGAFLPGQLVRVTVEPEGEERVVVIPRRALAGSPGAFSVTVRRGGEPAARLVEAEPWGEGLAIVRSGLAAGETVFVPAAKP